MTKNIKIPLKDLDPATIRDLQEKYPEAEVNLELHHERHLASLNEDRFWEVIALLDWEQKEDEATVEPAVARLAAGPVRHIYEFADLLSEKLYALDKKKYAREIGEDAWSPDRHFSVDNFLYARCCVVANGRELYEKVRQDPAQMPKDLTFEELLYVPGEAYRRKTGKAYDYVPAFPIETYSNEEGWED